MKYVNQCFQKKEKKNGKKATTLFWVESFWFIRCTWKLVLVDNEKPSIILNWLKYILETVKIATNWYWKYICENIRKFLMLKPSASLWEIVLKWIERLKLNYFS